jgi:hypothetical protein
MAGKFYVTEKLSFRKWRTPEGFLICYDVPLARTGKMLYGEGETPVHAGPDGIAHIERTPAEVFREETMRSAEGKPVVNEHPDSDVTPETWKELALGHVMNVRRGTGPEADLLLADLFIADKDAADLIESGKRELSCGYSADYDEFAPGYGRQRNILINHVALVEQGRCGPRCAIGDRQPKRTAMTKRSALLRWLDKARGYAFNGDEQAAVEMLKEGPARQATDEPEEDDMKKRHGRDDDDTSGHHTHIHLPPGDGARHDDDDDEGGTHSVEARVDKIEETVKGLAEAMSKMIALLEKAGGGEEEDGDDDDDAKGRRHHRARRHDDDDDAAKRRKHRDDDDDDDDGEKRRKHRDDDESEREKEREEEMKDGGRRRKSRHDSDNPEKEDKKIEGRLEEEAPPGSEEKAVKARDSAYLADSFRETVALAEILAPGIRIPTFDRGAKPVESYSRICGLRRQALDLAYQQPDGRGIIHAVNGGKPFRARDAGCGQIRTLFLAAAGMKRDANNGQIGARTSLEGLDLNAAPAGLSSVEELQAINTAFYAPKSS